MWRIQLTCYMTRIRVPKLYTRIVAQVKSGKPELFKITVTHEMSQKIVSLLA